MRFDKLVIARSKMLILLIRKRIEFTRWNADQFEVASENTAINLRFEEKVGIDSVTSEDFKDA